MLLTFKSIYQSKIAYQDINLVGDLLTSKLTVIRAKHYSGKTSYALYLASKVGDILTSSNKLTRRLFNVYFINDEEFIEDIHEKLFEINIAIPHFIKFLVRESIPERFEKIV